MKLTYRVSNNLSKVEELVSAKLKFQPNQTCSRVSLQHKAIVYELTKQTNTTKGLLEIS
jgi:hypothetical protein